MWVGNVSPQECGGTSGKYYLAFQGIYRDIPSSMPSTIMFRPPCHAGYISRSRTNTGDEEYENTSQVSVSTSKILFVYEAISDSVSEIQIMADGEATIALANKDDLANMGPSIETGTTRISGMANQELPQLATTVQISLTSRFDNE